MRAASMAAGFPIGTLPLRAQWLDRFIHWMRDLGFFQKPDVETLAAQDVADFVKQLPAKP